MKKPTTFNEILTSIKKKTFYPIYALHGEEEFFIDQIADALEAHALDEAAKAFNLTVVYGADTDVRGIKDLASRLPMMAERQVVIVREAQTIRSLPELVTYAEKPVPTTVLVLCYKHKKLDKRTSFYKVLEKEAIVFASEKLKDNKVTGWITDWVRDQGFDIEPEAANLAMDYVGTQLVTLSNELRKLIIGKPKGYSITLADIQDGVGISRDFNVFELQKAIGQRNHSRAFFIAQQMCRDIKGNHPIMVIGSLHNYFLKIYILRQMAGANDKDLAQAMGVNPYFMNEYKQAARLFPTPSLEHVFGILHDFDLRSKGIQNRRWKEEDLLMELVHHVISA